jgi:lipoyl(octanoyl) transferase
MEDVDIALKAQFDTVFPPLSEYAPKDG